jgi:hypothetical protein
MISFIKSEPVALQGMFQTTLALLCSFGFKLTVEQTGSILALTAAVLAVVTRSAVSPIK